MRHILFASALLAVSTLSHANRIEVQVPAVIDPSAPVPSAVREQCGVAQLVGNHTLEALNKRNLDALVAGPAAAAGARQLKLQIIAVHGHGGGAWSGAKSMTVRASLSGGGAAEATRVFSRHSSGGAFGGFKGTCAILERTARALGADIGKWISTGAKASASTNVGGTEEAEALPESEAPASEPAKQGG